MATTSGYSIEDMINLTSLEEGNPVQAGEALQEPKVEQLMDKVKRLQRGRRSLIDENKGLQSVKDMLHKELATLQSEAHQLEGCVKEKEELISKLQLQYEESEQESYRQLKQNKASEELLEQYRCEIQEVRLKHRKLRMKFQNQLQQLTEQHKQLYSVFSSARCPDELERAESTKSQLLLAEQQKLAQLQRLNEELEEVGREKEQEEVAAQGQE